MNAVEIAALLRRAMTLQPGDQLIETDLLQAQAVLRGAVLNLAAVDWRDQGRLRSTPINQTTIAAAVSLATAALSLQPQQKAAP